MSSSNKNGSSEKTVEIKNDIERTRGQMSKTVDQIEERLSPAHIKEQMRNVKESVLGEYHEAKDHLKGDISRELREAKQKFTGEIRHARTAVHDATVGRVEHMVHDARETVSDAGTTVLETIKANPVPAALVAVGLGWLLVSGRSSKTRTSGAARRMHGYRSDPYDHEYGDMEAYGDGGGYAYAGAPDDDSFGRRITRGPRRILSKGQRVAGRALHGVEDGVSNVGHRVAEGATNIAHRAEDVAHDAGEAVSHLAQGVGQEAAHLAHEARDVAMHVGHETRVRGRRVIRGAGRQVRRAEQTFETTLRDNPLAVGALAIAVGAAIGLALPHTRREDEWMGETKEGLLRRAKDAAGEAIHRVEETVGEKLTQGQQDDGIQVKDASQRQGHKNGVGNGLSGRSI